MRSLGNWCRCDSIEYRVGGKMERTYKIKQYAPLSVTENVLII